MCCEMFWFLFPEKKKNTRFDHFHFKPAQLSHTFYSAGNARTHKMMNHACVVLGTPPPLPLPSLKPIYSLSTRSPYRSHTDCNPFSRWICGGPTDDGGVGVWERCHSVGAELELWFKCVCVCKRESERGGKRGWGGGDYGVTAWFTPW